MVYRISVFLFIAAMSSSTFADSTTLVGFLTNSQGNWSGSGTVAIQGLGGTDGNYTITATKSEQSMGQSQWKATIQFKGMPGSAPTVTTLRVSGDRLTLTTTQFSAVATIETETATELAFRTVHTDPVTGHTVTNDQTQTFNADRSLHVVSDIYQGSNLVEHFDYTLVKQN